MKRKVQDNFSERLNDIFISAVTDSVAQENNGSDLVAAAHTFNSPISGACRQSWVLFFITNLWEQKQ